MKVYLKVYHFALLHMAELRWYIWKPGGKSNFYHPGFTTRGGDALRASPAEEVNRVAKPARIATQLGPLATRAALPNTRGCYYNYQSLANQ
ncbi:hypothetical protein PGT21_034433 [Puccinia graminis f. sp. tritici]|uniref:Uncharacterized protein n=1 Tax=Puccinia graminis f. sp. tritici TaxID=56615 RepID=A0A5B0NTN5_PUCGR|nr:hypothetical protein PGT21_034433 [Puccinia graminis f. sp. tritici]KAA1092016.1 hypothetical protein PGTUg99_014273 [Puccinia graminis f. sp. tritici]